MYLDHAGATPYANSLIESYARDLTASLYGNPHSVSASSQRTTSRVDDIRLRALRFFNADPDVYDLVFVSNATTGVKLVADAMRDGTSGESGTRGFWYGYHADSHTSLVGVREVAELGVRCFASDDEVATWISEDDDNKKGVLRLFSYPAQSNMNGRRLPLRWCEEIRRSKAHTWTLLDAAAYAATAPLDLGDPSIGPDFVVLSFHKIFGFPDLGGLIVRKDAGRVVFPHRRYFGGGTVDMVVARGTQWHAKKQVSLHDQLEDGTLPFHNIIALDHAMTAHERIFGSMANIAAHTRILARYLYRTLSQFENSKNKSVCRFYVSPGANYDDSATQGPIIAFNLRDKSGNWIGGSEIERLASIKGIHLRSGTLCNPGGVSGHLGLTDTEMQQNYEAGQRCGDENDILNGKPTGALRVSLGAMSSWSDVKSFVAFIEQFFLTGTALAAPSRGITQAHDRFCIESLHVYPIKSCAAYNVPPDVPWQITREGLAWDREWCIVHQGTNTALSQKRYPRMALIRPSFDFARGTLRISTPDGKSLEISLARDDDGFEATTTMQCGNRNSQPKLSRVCGDTVTLQVSTSVAVSSFFSDFLGAPCTLARLPPRTSSRYSKTRHASRTPTMPGAFPTPPDEKHTILLSNESPILLISRSSVNQLNREIQSASQSHITSSKVINIPAAVFRANIIVTENPPDYPVDESSVRSERPYLEDKWTSLHVGADGIPFDVLGSCQRCQMVCVDQSTGERRDEPYSTLARTRRMNGRVWFGRHLALGASAWEDFEESSLAIRAGDVVIPCYD